MGCWAIGGHGWGTVNESDSIDALKTAFTMGISLFDTADCYGLGHSESLISKTFGKTLGELMLCTKGGVRWDSSGKVWRDTSPQYLERALDNSLRRLGIESIPLYYIHKPDGKTPVEEAMTFLDNARTSGKIRAIGLSNFSAQEIERASVVCRVDAVQLRLNLLDWQEYAGLESVCCTHKIAIISWGSLADGLLTGKFNINSEFKQDDHRSQDPNFSGVRFAQNLEFVDRLSALSHEHGLSNATVAMRFLLQTTSVKCVLFGAKTSDQVLSNVAIGYALPDKLLQELWRLVRDQNICIIPEK
jgi:aryl-alcohol dehydrogenase-like predicted oxidoreductase